MESEDKSDTGFWIGIGAAVMVGVLLLCGCIVVFGFAFFGVSAVSVSAPPVSAPAFDNAAWIGGTPTDGSRAVRCGMTGALESEVLSVGMAKAAVDAALGAPDDVSEDGRLYTYDLGYCTLDYDVYIIEFDEADTVIDYRYVPG